MQNNNNNSKKNQTKTKNKNTTFKPEINQPNIRKAIVTKQVKPNWTSTTKTQVQKRHSDPPAPTLQHPKKRSPPTPPEWSVPAKRPNMDPDNKSSNEPVTDLSPELQCLHTLLQGDMERMMILPLKERMTRLEKSHESLELKGESIVTIQQENLKLREDCNNMMKENKHLKERLDRIEDKMRSNNIILHGIEDQVWESYDTTKEKVLLAISHTALGDTVEEKLDKTRKIAFKDIRRLGEYKANRKRPVLLEVEQKASAEFLLQQKKTASKRSLCRQGNTVLKLNVNDAN